ncbi:MAG: Crp/Fnr family transcriptional regulator [Calditrichaeota bacterium]|nr:Crp/Fnr family transcriptional regulator [Calditrichota bacterium]
MSFRYLQLRTVINQWLELEKKQWKDLKSIFTIMEYSENEHIVLPGENFFQLFFVNKGLFRLYYLDQKGKEFNKSFICENMFGGPVAFSILDIPLYYGMHTLEETSLLVANYNEFNALYDSHPIFDRLGRKLAEWLLIKKELRERSFLIEDAKERFLDFAKNYPGLLKRIPQYHIASYLGISEVSLSRLKNNI